MRDNRRTLVFMVLLALFAITPYCAFGQFENGSFVGTVHDSTGAVVPDATITALNKDTGIQFTRKTDASGNYEVPSVRVGRYRITATRSGFNTAVADNIALSVGSRQRVDLTLQIGGASQTVEVSDVALQLETETSQRGQVVTQYQTEALPLISRNYSDLVALTTGVRTSTIGIGTTGLVREGSFNVDGQRSMFNNYLLDGLDNNAYGESNQGFSNQIIQPAPDSVAQFQVVTNNESAEYGRASGATINVAFASGTNQLHGRVYEFLRNKAFNATGYFPPKNGKPQFNRNQFGFNLSGPILKDKLFYFVDYEGFRQTRRAYATASLPTDNERNGVFGIPVQDPYTGQVYNAGTSILSSPNISPLALNVISYLPQVGNPSSITNDYITSQRFTDFSDKGDLRLDWQIDAKSSSFLRISDRKETAVDFPVLPLPIDGGSNGRQQILDQQVALGYTRQIASNQLLDVRLGLSRTKAGKYTLSIGNNDFTVPGLPTDPTVAGGLSSTGISGGYSSLGRQATNPQWQNPALLNPKINYSWIRGNHSLKFGYEYQHVWMAVQDANPLYGSFTYSGAFSKTGASAATEDYFADYLFGASSAYSLATYFVAHLRQAMHFAYVQDDWKVSPKLTLNLGMRYEYGSPYWEQHNYLTNFDPATSPSTGQLLQAKDGSTYDRTLVNPDRADWGPRFGFAYALNDNTAFRGGFGISYVHYNRAGSGNILAINAPQALFVTVTQKTPTAASYRRMDQGFPADLAAPSSFNPLTDNITYIPKDYRDSYVESYFLSVQRQLAKNILLDVAYVGNHSLKLLEFANYNQGNPAAGVDPNTGFFQRPLTNWGDITVALDSAYSNFNSLQVRYEQRFVAGLTLLNSFTWSKTMDNAGASLESPSPSPQSIYNLAADYSQSDYNQPINNTTSLVYELPFGRGHRFLNRGGVVNSVLGGWQVSAINNLQSGLPFNLTYNPPTANQVSGIGASYRGSNLYRPNRIAGQPLIQKAKLSNGQIQYINLNALQIPAGVDGSGNLQSPFGNLGRNPVRSAAYYNTNLALNKQFNTPLERMKVEFRAEMYDAFNHTNFSTPGTTISGTQGKLASSGGVVSSTFDPRLMQFGLKVLF